MDLTFMLATFATLKVTRSHCFPAIQMNPDETDNADLAGDKSAWFGCQIWRKRSKAWFADVAELFGFAPPQSLAKTKAGGEGFSSSVIAAIRGVAEGQLNGRFASMRHLPFATRRSNGDYAANAAFHTVPQTTPSVPGWA